MKRQAREAGRALDGVQLAVPSADAIFDIKFCPFLPKDAPPIFAFTSGQNIFVARISPDPESSCVFSVLDAIEDIDDGRNTKTMGTDSYQCHNSLAWIRDTRTGNPLLLFTGTGPKIHVYDVVDRRYVRTLTGHGSGIQEIVPHPTVPSVFATCSDDNEVRLWNLDSNFEDSWCAIICHGEFGHTSTIYSIDFTKNGRYLMSGGRDTWMHLWALPAAEDLVQLPKEKVKSERIHYPHFSSADVHNDIVDCIRFYGDLIISRSVGFKITIWAIDGFNSEDPIPDPPTKRKPGQLTTSAFGAGFTVLHTLDFLGGTAMSYYYHRFSIFTGPDSVILAMGVLGKHTLHFWDLLKLELDVPNTRTLDGDLLGALQPDESFSPALDKDARKKNMALFRALDWSPDGKWLVAVYDAATLLVCWR